MMEFEQLHIKSGIREMYKQITVRFLYGLAPEATKKVGCNLFQPLMTSASHHQVLQVIKH